MGTPNPVDDKLRSLLGNDFLSYCTATGAEELSLYFNAGAPLPAAAEDALSRLVGICDDLVAFSNQSNTPVDMLWDSLGVLDADTGLTLANAVRRDAGGIIHQPTTSNELLYGLQQIAISLYPVLLIPPSGELMMPSAFIARSLRSYPATRTACAAIRLDDDLRQLLPPVTADENTRPLIGDYFAERLVESLILFAYNKTVFDNLRVPSVSEVCDRLVDTLAAARRLIRGKPVSLPVLTGLANIKLPEGVVIDSELGRLAPYHDALKRLAPRHLRERNVLQTSDQGQHEFYGAGNIVFHAETKYRLRLRSDSTGEGFGWEIKPTDPHQIENRHSMICLAATLSTDYETPVAVNPVWSVAFWPISNMAMTSWRDLGKGQVAPLRVLSAAEADQLNGWISRIARTGLGTAGIAAGRIQMAIAERTSPVDRLVDAVVAWENLFGAGEMTLRISSSLAWLLAGDAHARIAMQKECSDLYALRSRVVHGGKGVSDAEAATAGARALAIGVQALRRLYMDYPGMITATTTERSLSLILQGDTNVGSFPPS